MNTLYILFSHLLNGNSIDGDVDVYLHPNNCNNKRERSKMDLKKVLQRVVYACLKIIRRNKENLK